MPVYQKATEVQQTKPSSGYGKPPWIFEGRALYQLHLVKTETARAFIPKEFRLVEAFGYTLGGFFLASYDDSPAGIFDELVVIAGIVWNPPTSCAWAARVLVSNKEACFHGRKEIGLPSEVARFTKSITASPRAPSRKFSSFFNKIGTFSSSYYPKTSMDIEITEVDGRTAMSICNISLDSFASALKSTQWTGPGIKMSLPSFSGHTEYNPNLLKYSCLIECRVRPVSPAKVFGPPLLSTNGEHNSDCHNMNSGESDTEYVKENNRNLSISVMLSKPILALAFNCLKMTVNPPVLISKGSDNPIK